MALSCVYRAYNSDNELLYIGCTSNLKTRIACHKQLQRSEPETYAPWAFEISKVHVQFFNHRDTAMIEEEYLIKSENPAHNYQHNVCLITKKGRGEQYTEYVKRMKQHIQFKTTGKWINWDAL